MEEVLTDSKTGARYLCWVDNTGTYLIKALAKGKTMEIAGLFGIGTTVFL